jgi:hypothetical protein
MDWRSHVKEVTVTVFWDQLNVSTRLVSVLSFFLGTMALVCRLCCKRAELIGGGSSK